MLMRNSQTKSYNLMQSDLIRCQILRLSGTIKNLVLGESTRTVRPLCPVHLPVGSDPHEPIRNLLMGPSKSYHVKG